LAGWAVEMVWRWWRRWWRWCNRWWRCVYMYGCGVERGRKRLVQIGGPPTASSRSRRGRVESVAGGCSNQTTSSVHPFFLLPSPLDNERGGSVPDAHLSGQPDRAFSLLSLGLDSWVGFLGWILGLDSWVGFLGFLPLGHLDAPTRGKPVVALWILNSLHFVWGTCKPKSFVARDGTVDGLRVAGGCIDNQSIGAIGQVGWCLLLYFLTRHAGYIRPTIVFDIEPGL
jgi:hypothetical protein